MTPPGKESPASSEGPELAHEGLRGRMRGEWPAGATLLLIGSRRMSAVEFFPPLNASLNALSGILLVVAYWHIRAKRIALHKRFMLAACTTSVLFLISYVSYHTIRGGVVTKFAGTGGWKTLYLAILGTHTILAMVILPLAIFSVVYGLKMRVAQHRRVARWTFPLWMYVSVTGVLVYFFLYHWFPGQA